MSNNHILNDKWTVNMMNPIPRKSYNSFIHCWLMFIDVSFMFNAICVYLTMLNKRETLKLRMKRKKENKMKKYEKNVFQNQF